MFCKILKHLYIRTLPTQVSALMMPNSTLSLLYVHPPFVNLRAYFEDILDPHNTRCFNISGRADKQPKRKCGYFSV